MLLCVVVDIDGYYIIIDKGGTNKHHNSDVSVEWIITTHIILGSLFSDKWGIVISEGPKEDNECNLKHQSEDCEWIYFATAHIVSIMYYR